jgi:hypothetical protein
VCNHLNVLRRSIVVLFSTSLFLGAIVAAFWFQDWRYSLPTPKPPGLIQPPLGATLALAGAGLAAGSRPVLLHFFNPACPCSNFNVDHIRSLLARYGRRVRFLAVLQGEGDAASLQRAFDKLGLGMESVLDARGEIARLTGVYSTPQAVILDSQGRLYYRGNYNLARYCTSPETEFARLALESLVAGLPAPPLTLAASTVYGCPRPIRQAAR